MLYGDSAKPTQSDFGHPMTSLDPCQSSEDEGNVCKSASNSSRMHVEVYKTKQKPAENKSSPGCFFLGDECIGCLQTFTQIWSRIHFLQFSHARRGSNWFRKTLILSQFSDCSKLFRRLNSQSWDGRFLVWQDVTKTSRGQSKKFGQDGQLGMWSGLAT